MEEYFGLNEAEELVSLHHRYFYAGGSYEVMVSTSTTTKQYYSIGGMTVAMYDSASDELMYMASDHLTSASVMLEADGDLLSEQRYMPFGEVRLDGGDTITETDLGYTGQRQEASLDLYFYNARWYDPALGRFAQADTVLPDPGDAKSFDRYAYVHNNPLIFTDPSGHSLWKCMADPQCAKAYVDRNKINGDVKRDIIIGSQYKPDANYLRGYNGFAASNWLRDNIDRYDGIIRACTLAVSGGIHRGGGIQMDPQDPQVGWWGYTPGEEYPPETWGSTKQWDNTPEAYNKWSSMNNIGTVEIKVTGSGPLKENSEFIESLKSIRDILKPGDLIFFNDGEGSWDHVAMFSSWVDDQFLIIDAGTGPDANIASERHLIGPEGSDNNSIVDITIVLMGD